MTSPARIPRCIVNRGAKGEAIAPRSGAEATSFHRGLAGYAPSPLHTLPDAASELSVGRIYVKDESDRFGLPSFKILGASWALEKALRNDPTITQVIAASAGNHGRAVAHAAARRGLKARIFLPARTSSTRALPIEDEGAEVIYVDGDYEAAVSAAAREAQNPRSALIADTTSSEAKADTAEWVIEGYATLFREAANQAKERFDLIVVPSGVGALTAAAVLFALHEQSGAHVIGVEPQSSACVTASLVAGALTTIETQPTDMVGLDCATPSLAAWPILEDGLSGTVTIDDDEAHREMRYLAEQNLAIGDCGAATLAALRALTTDERCTELRAACEIGADSTMLCVATEGATDPAAYARVLGNAPQVSCLPDKAARCSGSTCTCL